MRRRRIPALRSFQAAVGLASLILFNVPADAARPTDAERARAQQAQAELDASRLEASYNSGSTFVRDPAVDAYLKSIVDRLVAANPDAGAVPVRIHALRAPLPYAFGLDNGALYVSTGLLARLQNESQLAGLIATEMAPTVRHDNTNSNEITRERTVRRALPNILLVTVTAGIAAFPLNKADSDARRELDTRLRLESDRMALGWLQRAGYDVEQIPKGLERLRDALAAEQRSGLGELAHASGLNARVESLKHAMSDPRPEAPPAAATVTAAAPAPSAPPAQATSASEFASLSHRLALEMIREDMSGAESKSVMASLDRLESEAGPAADTSCLRADFVRRSATDPARLPEAIRAFQVCTGFADAPAVTFRELGFLQRKQGDSAGARRSFEQYLKRAPNAVDAPIIRGYMEGL